MTARAKADVRVGQKKPNQGRGRAKGGKICFFSIAFVFRSATPRSQE